MSNLLLALQITGLGMGLVFAAIVLLWWLMSLLTTMTADKEIPSGSGATSESSETTSRMASDLKAQAAAVAVAIALAEQQASGAHPLSDPPTAIVSPWQLGMRTRQMYQKSGPIRRRAG